MNESKTLIIDDMILELNQIMQQDNVYEVLQWIQKLEYPTLVDEMLNYIDDESPPWA